MFGGLIYYNDICFVDEVIETGWANQKSRLQHAYTPTEKICKGTNKNPYILIKINKVLNKKMLINNTRIIRFLQFLIFNQLFFLFRLILN